MPRNSGANPMIAFPCPRCNTTLKAPEEKAGARTKCSICGFPVQVPGAGPPAVAEVPPVATPAESTARGQPAAKREGFPRWLLAVILPAAGALLLCCCGGIGFVAYRWGSGRAPAAPQQDAAVANAPGKGPAAVKEEKKGGGKADLNLLGMSSNEVLRLLGEPDQLIPGGPAVGRGGSRGDDVWVYNKVPSAVNRKVNVRLRKGSVIQVRYDDEPW